PQKTPNETNQTTFENYLQQRHLPSPTIRQTHCPAHLRQDQSLKMSEAVPDAQQLMGSPS
ncbi:unnamed protein product, partial [Penicillium nalgiovense]